jgi:hypothetical protein
MRWRKPVSARLPILALLIVAAPLCAAAQSNRSDDRSAVYCPDTAWQHKTPQESGLDPGRLIVIHQGYIVAEWGEPRRVDMTHSVTKSMLSSVIGVAYDRGMIRGTNDTVQSYMASIQVFSPLVAGNKSDRLRARDLLFPFDTPHNRTITWDHMLRQTSDWEGTLWGKPD